MAPAQTIQMRNSLAFKFCLRQMFEKTESILTRTTQDGVLKQIWQDIFKTGAVFVHQVGGNFTLVSYPIVAAQPGFLNGLKHGIDSLGQGVKHRRPLEMSKFLTELLRNRQVSDLSKSVVIAFIRNPLLIQILSQTFTTIDVYLDLEGKPTLQTNVDETQFSVQVVKVEMQTLCLATRYFQPFRLPIASHRKSGANFQCGENTDQAFLHLVFLHDAPCQIFFALPILGSHGRFQIAKGSSCIRSDLFRMLFHLLAHPFNIGLELFQQHTLAA